MKIEIDRGMIVFGPDETTIPSVRRNMFEKDEQVMRSVTFSYAQKAAQDFNKIFGGRKVFDNPKSFLDLERLVSYLSEPGDVILDFFAGTNTTMHGVLRANRGVSLPRRSICVQMAEPVKPGTEAGNNALALGLKTIAEIARDRMRRVLSAEDYGKHAGFRAFKLMESNVRRWAGIESKDADAYAEQLDAFTDTLVQGWRPENVIWEVALREGYSLTLTMENLPAPKGVAFWRVTDPAREQAFTVCLDDNLTVEAVATLGLSKGDLFVCRATALDDTLAANLALQCRLKVI
jgi:adenine-specific DNA-methyltransferase